MSRSKGGDLNQKALKHAMSHIFMKKRIDQNAKEKRTNALPCNSSANAITGKRMEARKSS